MIEWVGWFTINMKIGIVFKYLDINMKKIKKLKKGF